MLMCSFIILKNRRPWLLPRCQLLIISCTRTTAIRPVSLISDFIICRTTSKLHQCCKLCTDTFPSLSIMKPGIQTRRPRTEPIPLSTKLFISQRTLFCTCSGLCPNPSFPFFSLHLYPPRQQQICNFISYRSV